MPQPIDRYLINQDKGSHGAIFAFANGTNPEVLLFLESDDNGWRYGLSRMCGAEPTVKFDNNVVWNEPSMDAIKKSWKLGYTGEAHVVEPAPSDAGK